MAICTSAWRIVYIDLQAVTLDDNNGADIGDSNGDDSTVGGTGDKSPGPPWVQSDWETTDISMKVQVWSRNRGWLKKERKKEGWNKEAETGQGTLWCVRRWNRLGPTDTTLWPLLSSSAGGEAGEDISGCSGSPHLVFSRLWSSKYELVQWGFLALIDGFTRPPDAWLPSPWACLPGFQGARPPWLLLTACLAPIQSFPKAPGAL